MCDDPKYQGWHHIPEGDELYKTRNGVPRY